MLLAEMAVNFHCQSTAVAVTEPAGEGRNVKAAFDAPGGTFGGIDNGLARGDNEAWRFTNWSSK